MTKKNFGKVKEPDTIYVWFVHDMEDAWYDAEFPDSLYNGGYNHAEIIKKIARKHKWKILYNRDDPYEVFKL